jgi:hypothetical protein
MKPLVASVIDLTDRVEAAIEGGDWPRAQEIETERRHLLEQLAVTGDAEVLAPTFAALEARNHPVGRARRALEAQDSARSVGRPDRARRSGGLR